MSHNNTDDFIEVEYESANLNFSKDEFKNNDVIAPLEDKILSDVVDMASDTTMTEATSGSSIEDVPNSRQCKRICVIIMYLVSRSQT